MRSRFAPLVDAGKFDRGLAWRTRFDSFSVVLEVPGEPLVTLRAGPQGIVLEEGAQETRDAHFIASAQTWDQFMASPPPIGYQTIGSMIERGHLVVRGADPVLFGRMWMVIEVLFAKLQQPRGPEPAAPAVGTFEPVRGGYLWMDLNGRMHRIYYEEAGEGMPLLCLHTAGADSRQFRDLINDADILRNYRVLVPDLPRHGKSSPPVGFEREEYRLTTDDYVGFIMAFKVAMGLEKPVVLGCSIGGRVILHLAFHHPDDWRALIGLQAATHAVSYLSERLDMYDRHILFRPDVHGEVAAASLKQAMSPTSPSSAFWETLWHCMQSGPGIFLGDLWYFMVDGVIPDDVVRQIDTKRTPIHLLSGEYDLSATKELTQELAKLLNPTSLEIMTGLGHFPMSENYPLFRRYLLPLLDTILRAGAADQSSG